MKKLSDYKGDETIDLWADLLEPFGKILGDTKVQKELSSGQNMLNVAGKILKSHKEEVKTILLRIDDTPLNGVNILSRLVGLLLDVSNSEEFEGFFGSPETKMNDASSGSATANIEVEEK